MKELFDKYDLNHAAACWQKTVSPKSTNWEKRENKLLSFVSKIHILICISAMADPFDTIFSKHLCTKPVFCPLTKDSNSKKCKLRKTRK